MKNTCLSRGFCNGLYINVMECVLSDRIVCMFAYLQLHLGVDALMLMLAMSSNDLLRECCVLGRFGRECHGRFTARPLRPARRLLYVRVRAERLGPLRRLDAQVLLVFARCCKSAYRVA